MLEIQKLSEKATLLFTSYGTTVGHDLYTANEITIPPKGCTSVPSDLRIQVPFKLWKSPFKVWLCFETSY